jgi:hypothetical protein
MKIPISRFLGKVKNTRESDMVIGTSHRESNMSVAHTCQPLKPSMREISPSAMTAEGELHDALPIYKNMECYEYCPDSEVLKKAKTACINYNNELKK